MSFRTDLKHRNDVLLHRGFNYHGKIFTKTVSNVFYLEEKRAKILDEYDKVFSFLIDSIKHIKKTFHFAYDKDFINFN